MSRSVSVTPPTGPHERILVSQNKRVTCSTYVHPTYYAGKKTMA